MTTIFGTDTEWLEPDGLGGFASGTVAGIRSRRYHALLLAARTPPTDRFVLVSGLEVWADTPAGSFPLSAHLYTPGVVYPAGHERIDSFTPEPWPTWTFKLDDLTRLRHEVFVPHGHTACIATWTLLTPDRPVTLRVRPLLTVRDYHALHHENAGCGFLTETSPGRVSWRPYHGCPKITARFGGAYSAKPDWYRSFLYAQEQARGLDAVEDCASPGEFTFELGADDAEARLILSADTPPDRPLPGGTPAETVRILRERETARRAGLGTGLERAADAYLAQRGIASTVIAGFPWFTDWGRDTFIAIRGLCLATGRLETARDILVEWSRAQVDGLLPNRFPDAGEAPEFHSVDAALWYVQAAHDFLALAIETPAFKLSKGDEKLIRRTCVRALQAYAKGTLLGIVADENDGLLRCGVGDSSLTWMDARVDGGAVTPRIGKPVEIQALWINALLLCQDDEPSLAARAKQAQASFTRRFWNPDRGCLFDVIDAGHKPGATDASLRPNQLLAVGGLTNRLVKGAQAKSIVALCERELVTPMGLRTLGPQEPGYTAHYISPLGSGPGDRDRAYHNGTVWPWLMGPFAEAWVRVRRNSRKARREARERFLQPLLESTKAHGLGHIAEIADAEPPHTPRGCPFQAWSVGEALRLDRVVLRD